MKSLFLSILCLVCTVCASGAGRFLVTDFGAKGDGMTIDSRAINSAIEAAASSGGGSVIFPRGGNYPEPASHGIQPAWGLSLIHAEDITLKDVTLELLSPDERPMIHQSHTKRIFEK